jgi:carbonic anhydrase/acetyltransferase-like protein (isoleucine patch superfamily)
MILPHRGIMPRIDPTAFVAPGAVIVGDVEIGPGSSVWFGCVLRGDVNAIRVGRDVNIQDGTIVHVAGRDVAGGGGRTEIGDEVAIGHLALIHACTLEPGAFVGMRATVMDGAVVEGGAIVAAGALVTPRKRVPAGEVWAGNPARLLRPAGESDRAMVAYTWVRYRALAEEYRGALAARPESSIEASPDEHPFAG